MPRANQKSDQVNLYGIYKEVEDAKDNLRYSEEALKKIKQMVYTTNNLPKFKLSGYDRLGNSIIIESYILLRLFNNLKAVYVEAMERDILLRTERLTEKRKLADGFNNIIPFKKKVTG